MAEGGNIALTKQHFDRFVCLRWSAENLNAWTLPMSHQEFFLIRFQGTGGENLLQSPGRQLRLKLLCSYSLVKSPPQAVCVAGNGCNLLAVTQKFCIYLHKMFCRLIGKKIATLQQHVRNPWKLYKLLQKWRIDGLSSMETRNFSHHLHQMQKACCKWVENNWDKRVKGTNAGNHSTSWPSTQMDS